MENKEEKIEELSEDESIKEETDNESIPAESDLEESEAEESEAEESEAEESEVEEPIEIEEEEEGADPEEVADEPVREKKKRTKRTVVSNIGIEMLKTTKNVPAINYDDDEDEEDVNYLQKFDNSMRENFIMDHHPEARTHNYEEVKALSRVSRDGNGIIIDPLHKTIPFLTKYEMTRVIGQRAKQLDSGARTFVKVPLNVVDGYHIALLELEQKKLPFIIKRPYPNGGVEYWNVSDLEILI
jgi:DNA-directed RNA polymerase subunit K/omega